MMYLVNNRSVETYFRIRRAHEETESESRLLNVGSGDRKLTYAIRKYDYLLISIVIIYIISYFIYLR